MELWSFILTKILNSSLCYGIGDDTSLGVGTTFNLAWINTIPCMCTSTLPLSDSVLTDYIVGIHRKDN